MIPVKIQCGCGQKYSFEVEPVNGQMANAVACPVCGVDGTVAANQIIAQTLAARPAVAPPPPPPPSLATARPALATALPAQTPARTAARPIAKARPASSGEFNLGLGILGAFLGSAVGGGAMYGF